MSLLWITSLDLHYGIINIMDTSQLKNFFAKKNIGLFILGAVVLAVVLLNLGDKQKEEAPIARKSGACIPLSGAGKQTYDILTDKPGKLQVAEVHVDPIDVKEGETQTITVKVKDKNNNTITKESGVVATIKTDNKNTAAVFKLINATDETSDDGSKYFVSLWEGSWIREDSNCYAYMETITATNDKGDEAKVDLSFK